MVDEPAAVAEDDRGRERREQVDGREVDPVQDDRLVVGAAIAVVDAVERLLLHRLARERLHDPHARDVLGERRRHEAQPLAHVPIGPVGAAAEPGGRERHQRQHGQRRERELPVEEEEDDRRAHQQQRVLDQACDAVRHELVERLDVVRDPADDYAGSVALVEPERQALEVREEPVAQVGEDALADPARQVRVHPREQEGRDRRQEEEPDDQGQPAEVELVDALVDRELGEVGRQERDERVEEERRERERRPPLVRQRQPGQQAEPSPGSAPRPVPDLAAALLREMPAGLPDLHAHPSRVLAAAPAFMRFP